MGRTLRDLASFATELASLGSCHEFSACMHERSEFGRGTSNDDIIRGHGFTVPARSL
jgi:hypothetical protein